MCALQLCWHVGRLPDNAWPALSAPWTHQLASETACSSGTTGLHPALQVWLCDVMVDVAKSCCTAGFEPQYVAMQAGPSPALG